MTPEVAGATKVARFGHSVRLIETRLTEPDPRNKKAGPTSPASWFSGTMRVMASSHSGLSKLAATGNYEPFGTGMQHHCYGFLPQPFETDPEVAMSGRPASSHPPWYPQLSRFGAQLWSLSQAWTWRFPRVGCGSVPGIDFLVQFILH